MIYVNNEWLSAQAGLVQLVNETKGSHKKFKIKCDSQKSTKCRKEYEIAYKDYLRHLSKNNNEKIFCLFCSRAEKHSGRLNPNAKYHNINDNFFNKIDTLDKAYLLGWIGSDGHISNAGFTIKIHTKDIVILTYIKNIICTDVPIFNKVFTYTDMSGFTINSKQISKDLCLLFNISPGKKSNTINFPNIDQKYYYEFIRGYFDGDGTINSIRNKRGYPQSMITSDSPLMLLKIKEILGFGFIYKSTFEMSVKDTFTFCERIYTPNRPKLERKYQRYLEWIEYYEQKKQNKNGIKK